MKFKIFVLKLRYFDYLLTLLPNSFKGMFIISDLNHARLQIQTLVGVGYTNKGKKKEKQANIQHRITP